MNQLKVKFFRVFNCIYARSKAVNSEMVTVELLKAYCLPFLLYGLESVSPSKSQLRSLNNCINRAVYKVFDVNDAVCVNDLGDLRCFVGLHDVEELVERRRLVGCLPYFDTSCGPSANLECRSERCCTRLAANAEPKKVAKNRHLGTIGQLCRAISSQLRHVSTIGKKTC